MRRLRAAKLLSSLVWFVSACRPSPEPTLHADSGTKTLDDVAVFHASQPRYLRPVPFQVAPQGLADLKSATCGACHDEIYREWRISTHARAYKDDAQFLAELEKSTQPGHDVGWMCMNCHTPLENQLPKLVAGLDDGSWKKPIYVQNSRFQPELVDDAIGCATCHVRDGVIMGPFGDTKAPHPVRLDPSLKTESVCTQCHQAVAELPEVNLACSFDTGNELAKSPYAAEGKVCSTCHMPEVERRLSIDTTLPPRKTRRHWFGGSLIAKRPEFQEEIKALEQHYPEGSQLRWVKAPKSAKSGQDLEVLAEIENVAAGHMLPTGDPERYILVDIEARDETGQVVASVQERLGQLYEWWPKVKKLADTRLAPKEIRPIRLLLPKVKRGRLELVLRGSKFRISPENMKLHNLEGRYVAGRTFFEERRSLVVR